MKAFNKIVESTNRIICDEKVFSKAMMIAGCIFIPVCFVCGFWNPIYFLFAVMWGLLFRISWREYRQIIERERSPTQNSLSKSWREYRQIIEAERRIIQNRLSKTPLACKRPGLVRRLIKKLLAPVIREVIKEREDELVEIGLRAVQDLRTKININDYRKSNTGKLSA